MKGVPRSQRLAPPPSGRDGTEWGGSFDSIFVQWLRPLRPSMSHSPHFLDRYPKKQTDMNQITMSQCQRENHLAAIWKIKHFDLVRRARIYSQTLIFWIKKRARGASVSLCHTHTHTHLKRLLYKWQDLVVINATMLKVFQTNTGEKVCVCMCVCIHLSNPAQEPVFNWVNALSGWCMLWKLLLSNKLRSGNNNNTTLMWNNTSHCISIVQEWSKTAQLGDGISPLGKENANMARSQRKRYTKRQRNANKQWKMYSL